MPKKIIAFGIFYLTKLAKVLSLNLEGEGEFLPCSESGWSQKTAILRKVRQKNFFFYIFYIRAFLNIS
jgi:hypothetical protein